jgi:serine/threonine-protein kinase HipA
MYRRMVFNVLAKNCDDHTKNFSFRLKQGGQWELAPAYDICHAYQPQHRWVSQHALSVNGKRQQITSDDLIQVGNSIRTQKMKPKEIIQEISDIIRGWKKYADQYGVPAKLRDAIAETHQFA